MRGIRRNLKLRTAVWSELTHSSSETPPSEKLDILVKKDFEDIDVYAFTAAVEADASFAGKSPAAKALAAQLMDKYDRNQDGVFDLGEVVDIVEDVQAERKAKEEQERQERDQAPQSTQS